MSKVNAMQAMREARYAAGPPVTSPAARPARPAVPDPAAQDPGAADPGVADPRAADLTGSGRPPVAEAPPGLPGDDGEPIDLIPSAELCGHRSMNNRICRRPSGHAEKNHRYQ